MATCNDCVHYEACKKIFQISFKDFTDYTFVKTCELYKPTADVVEVKRGEWVSHHPDGSAICSVCGRKQKDVWDFDNWQNYCGHCGADMRGEEK